MSVLGSGADIVEQLLILADFLGSLHARFAPISVVEIGFTAARKANIVCDNTGGHGCAFGAAILPAGIASKFKNGRRRTELVVAGCFIATCIPVRRGAFRSW
ncbi:hypothetical protein [Mesorhizobium captivum]|uniref:hypothetical protein n=1 Tax=Mesorhizobium captivum TaxID=3072319 RepID=UPI002A23E91D|nr:hypothetical protein [Mesorhizobium sp. VK23E]MDX8514540.1 hypothetical protein [Mesorhizobium sp. VK23E]